MMKKITLLVVLICLFSATPVVAKFGQLYGWVRWQNGQPAQGVTMSIGGYSIVTNQKGYYGFSSIYPGLYVISISPPRRPTRSFRVNITGSTQQDFIINW